MSRRFIAYILTLLGVALLTACGSDFPEDMGGSGEAREFSGTLAFDLSTPDVTDLTRSVSTAPGASILLKNLWLGVFDTTTGACFGAKKYDEMDKLMQSGVLMKDMLTVDFVAKGENLPLAYIVAVANYDGVTTWDGTDLGGLLPDFDQRADMNWEKLIGLGIDTRSAYAGDKGEDEASNAPFLAGFFQDAVSLRQNPLVDQFSYAALGPTAIYPATAAEGMDIALGDASDNKIYVAEGAICLRRLTSHNTVRLRTNNGYEVTAAKYKRFNMPRAVYMLQRRTDTNRPATFGEWQRRSPNFADHLLSEGSYDASAEKFPYACDKEWIPVEIPSWDDTENVEFTFDHFENKHWGAEHLTGQNDREARNADGTFAALCSGNGDAYNNFASYFVLNLHIVNKSTGESADVEYTLHEGYCNDADGRAAASAEVKSRDFTSLRNVHYTYNINISGIDDITSSVTSQDAHANGQAGTIWKMYYANEESKTIPIAGGTFNFGGKYLTFSGKPDLGFRICGRDASGGMVDICYNMPEGMYDGFAGLWPSGSPQYIDRLDDLSIPANLLNDMKISSGATDYTLSDFVKGVQSGSIPPTGSYSFKFAAYDNPFTGMTGNLVRGLYIFDRNDIRNAADADGCSYNIAYGAEQYPFEPQTVKFDINNILWDNTYYQAAATVKNVFAAATPIFYGAECSKIDLRWKHDPRFAGYSISVYNASYTHPTIVVGPNTIDRYLHDLKGEKIFIYPLNTAEFPRSTGTGANNYSFSVTPIVDNDIYKVAGPTVVEHKSSGNDDTCIRVCPTTWETAVTNDWKNIQLAGKTGGVDIHYRGLQAFCTSDIGSNYNNKSYICFGLGGSTIDCYFSFWASVPGTLAVTCNSHSAATDRPLVIARMSESGSMTNSWGEKYDEIYNSGTMATSTSKTTYNINIVPTDGQPTEFRIYARGSIDYYKFQFTPSN